MVVTELIYRKFVSYKKHIYEKHIKISHAGGAGLLQSEDMEVLSDDRQDGFDKDDSISLSPNDVVANNLMKISALFLLKLENEFKVTSTVLDCIIEDVTTLLDNKIDSFCNELVAKLSQRNIVFDSEINSVFENAVVRNPFEGLHSEYFRDKYSQEELQFLVS